MDADQIARLQKEINALMDSKNAGFENIAAVVEKYSQEVGEKIDLEFRIEKIFLNVGNKQQEIALAGRCFKAPCPYGGPGCYVPC